MDRRAWRRLRPAAGWVAGVAAGVVSTVIATNLMKPAAPQYDPPFTVAVRTFPSLMFVFDGQEWQAPDRPVWDGDGDAWYEWARHAGAVPTELIVEVTVQGRSEAEVTLTDLRVRVVGRQPAPAGVLFGPAMGGGDTFRAAAADLDDEPPVLGTYGGRPGNRVSPLEFPYRISISDAETFHIVGQAEECLCDWVIDLSWASEGRTGTVTIDDGGQPFRVSGSANVVMVCDPATMIVPEFSSPYETCTIKPAARSDDSMS